MSAPANGQMAEKQARKSRKTTAKRAEIANRLDQAASAHLKAHCADLPWHMTHRVLQDVLNYCMHDGCFESDAERNLRLAGSVEEYWSLKCAGGESYGCQAFNMATGGDYLARLTRTRLYGFYVEGGGVMPEGQFLNSVRMDLMSAYGSSQSAISSATNPQWLSAGEITQQHWKVFSNYNIPPQAFGATPFANFGQSSSWW